MRCSAAPPFFCKLFWGFFVVHKDSIFRFFTVQVAHEPGTRKIQITHFFVQTGSMQQVCLSILFTKMTN